MGTVWAGRATRSRRRRVVLDGGRVVDVELAATDMGRTWGFHAHPLRVLLAGGAAGMAALNWSSRRTAKDPSDHLRKHTGLKALSHRPLAKAALAGYLVPVGDAVLVVAPRHAALPRGPAGPAESR